MDSDTLERLETRIAFLDHANTVLSEEVLRQQREIDTLRNRLEALAAIVRAAQNADAEPRTAEDERPPHY
jgi:SlyX protein